MAVAPQSNESRRSRRQSRRDRRHGAVPPTMPPSGRSPHKVVGFPSTRTNVANIPEPAPQPQWLGRLRRIYRWSSVALVGLGVAIAGVYSQTVRLEQDLGQTYTRLQDLQRQERELTVAMEQLKDHIARQAAQPDSGLSLPKPDAQLFLQPAQPNAPPQPRPNAVPVIPEEESADTSVGY